MMYSLSNIKTISIADFKYFRAISLKKGFASSEIFLRGDYKYPDEAP